MITGSGVYHAVETMAPLYTAAALGYASVRWLGAFSEEQCAGINHFVATYALPALVFDMVSTNDPYAMNARLVAADTLQKRAMLLGLLAWAAWPSSRCRGERLSGRNSALRWVVTAFSVAQLPSIIIMGVPLLSGMYGPASKDLMKQIVVMQFCLWYNVVIFMYEYMAATDGSTKASLGLPEKRAIAAVERVHQVTVNVESTEHTRQQGMAVAGQQATAALTTEVCAGEDDESAEAEDDSLPASPSMRHIAFMTGKKVLRIPNSYASFLGLVWALITFKCGIKMPKIILDSLFTIQTTTIGLSMFSSGTFMARQPQFIPCGYAIAMVSLVLKFLIGPVAMLLASLAVGMHGTLLRIAVVQAALPLAVASFVYAEEYKVHAEIMSTGVILGILISFPVTIVYYILLEL
ncbi:hypothetical protein CFC21_104448 [Triticum aestivum]|uniref:Auxin efflux carrier component n=2 Tax=Triticum aestivum TaxID=4565 RepID=A0A9R1MA12_WHEAT|nr:probable auxin efflux carrier component 9 [Triticum aestivum]KAF7103460.1 hypothetical protein CFC21_104448 [Triticum aestivum]